MNRFLSNLILFEKIHKYLKIQYQGEIVYSYKPNPQKYVFINLYYHFSLVNLTAATESATSYEHAHCAWYTKLLMDT